MYRQGNLALWEHFTEVIDDRVPGLRLGRPRSRALLSALLMFRQQPHGFTNRDLRAATTELRGLTPGAVTAGQITYDLRRLRVHGLITRIPHTHRYRVTDPGLDTAKFLTCVHDRVLCTGLAELAAPTPASGRLKTAATAYRKCGRQPHHHNVIRHHNPVILTATRNLDSEFRLRRY